MMEKIRLNKELFLYDDILQSIEVFSDICNFSVGNQGNYYLCYLKSSIYDEEETIKEFENYLIDLSNKKHY